MAPVALLGVGLDPFALGAVHMDAAELRFALGRYTGFRRAAARQLRVVRVRNVALGFLAFLAFWVVAAAPLVLLLRVLSVWLAGLLVSGWCYGLFWVVTTHPTLKDLSDRWVAERQALEDDVATHTQTIASLRRELARR